MKWPVEKHKIACIRVLWPTGEATMIEGSQIFYDVRGFFRVYSEVIKVIPEDYVYCVEYWKRPREI